MALNFLLSGLHIELARAAVERIGPEDADYDERKDAISALVFSALSLEAIINELPLGKRSRGETDIDAKLNSLADILEESQKDNAQIKLRYNLARFALTGATYDRGAQPYQDFSLLVDLRNALVHLKPETIEELHPHRLVERLSKRAACHPRAPREIASWVNTISTRPVGVWALGVVKAVCLDLAKCLGPKGHLISHLFVSLGVFRCGDFDEWLKSQT